jgi:hypothetical protein
LPIAIAESNSLPTISSSQGKPAAGDLTHELPRKRTAVSGLQIEERGLPIPGLQARASVSSSWTADI